MELPHVPLSCTDGTTKADDTEPVTGFSHILMQSSELILLRSLLVVQHVGVVIYPTLKCNRFVTEPDLITEFSG